MHPKDSPRGYLDISEVPLPPARAPHGLACISRLARRLAHRHGNIADPRVTCCQVGYGLGELEVAGAGTTEAVAGQMSDADGGSSLVTAEMVESSPSSGVPPSREERRRRRVAIAEAEVRLERDMHGEEDEWERDYDVEDDEAARVQQLRRRLDAQDSQAGPRRLERRLSF